MFHYANLRRSLSYFMSGRRHDFLSSGEFDTTYEDNNVKKLERKVISLKYDVTSIHDRLNSISDEILKTIRSMPPAMGEDYASTARQFKYGQEEELKNRKKGK